VAMGLEQIKHQQVCGFVTSVVEVVVVIGDVVFVWQAERVRALIITRMDIGNICVNSFHVRIPIFSSHLL